MAAPPCRVLVVDDDPPLRTGMARLLEMRGHAVVTAASVGEGLEKLGAGPTHLILDLNLPDGLGTTVLRHVRENDLPVEVAVLSGSDDASLLAEAQTLRPDGVFKKPPDWDALLK